MICRKSILLVCICALLVACPSELNGDYSDYRVQAIGCLLPIPKSYILNTDNESGYLFYDSSESSFGIIRIDTYDKSEMDELLLQSEVLEKREAEGRVALSILWKFDASMAAGLPAAIFHDYAEVVTIVGDEVSSWETRFDTCLKSPTPPRPKDFPELLRR